MEEFFKEMAIRIALAVEIIATLVIAYGALEALVKAGDDARVFLNRHMTGDWGIVGDEDGRLNDEALKHGGRLLPAYRTSMGVKLWVLTEADRSATTILLPSEY